MSLTLGELVAYLRVEDKGFDQSINKAEKTFGGMGKSALAMGAAFGVALGAAGLAGILKDAVGAASKLQESASKSKVVFGSLAKEVEAFGDSAAEALGQSKQAAIESTATFGNLFVSMKMGQDVAADMSMSIVSLASDLASFNNTSVDDAILALRAGLVGEAEPLRKYGVNLNEAALKQEALRLGLEATTATLDPAVRAQAAYSLIMQQTTTAQGDFARTSDGLANSQKTLGAVWEDLKATLGESLLPLVTEGVQALSGLAEKVKDAAADGDWSEVSGLIAGAIADGVTWGAEEAARNAPQIVWALAKGLATGSVEASTALAEGLLGGLGVDTESTFWKKGTQKQVQEWTAKLKSVSEKEGRSAGSVLGTAISEGFRFGALNKWKLGDQDPAVRKAVLATFTFTEQDMKDAIAAGMSPEDAAAILAEQQAKIFDLTKREIEGLPVWTPGTKISASPFGWVEQAGPAAVAADAAADALARVAGAEEAAAKHAELLGPYIEALGGYASSAFGPTDAWALTMERVAGATHSARFEVSMYLAELQERLANQQEWEADVAALALIVGDAVSPENLLAFVTQENAAAIIAGLLGTNDPEMMLTTVQTWSELVGADMTATAKAILGPAEVIGADIPPAIAAGVASTSSVVGAAIGLIPFPDMTARGTTAGKQYTSGLQAVLDLFVPYVPGAPSGSRFTPGNNALGSIVTSPTLTWVGEAGPEVIAPMNNPARAHELINAAGLGTGAPADNSELIAEMQAMQAEQRALRLEFARQNDRLIQLKVSGAVA